MLFKNKFLCAFVFWEAEAKNKNVSLRGHASYTHTEKSSSISLEFVVSEAFASF